jgi:hypothetical protein
MYAALSQDVAGLEVGRQYQLSVPIYTDIYDWEDKKVAPWDASHGQFGWVQQRRRPLA